MGYDTHRITIVLVSPWLDLLHAQPPIVDQTWRSALSRTKPGPKQFLAWDDLFY